MGSGWGGAIRAPHVPSSHADHFELASKRQSVDSDAFLLVRIKTGRGRLVKRRESEEDFGRTVVARPQGPRRVARGTVQNTSQLPGAVNPFRRADDEWHV